MLWSFIAVCLSAWLSVDASYRGPTWQRWVFKPLTLLLLLLLAWQAPMFDAISYLVLAGLCASLLGDALTLLPRQRLMYAIGAFFLSHLLYTIYFASQMTLSFFWPLNAVMAGIFARYVWLNRSYFYAVCFAAMLVYDGLTSRWGMGFASLLINFSNIVFIVTLAQLVLWDKRRADSMPGPINALNLFCFCLLAALLCAAVGGRRARHLYSPAGGLV